MFSFQLNSYIGIDEKNKKVALQESKKKKRVFDFDEVVSGEHKYKEQHYAQTGQTAYHSNELVIGVKDVKTPTFKIYFGNAHGKAAQCLASLEAVLS